MSASPAADQPAAPPASAASPGGGPLVTVPIFAKLNDVEQQDLLGQMKPRSAGMGEVVVWHGEPGQSLFLIRSGSVAVSVPSRKGDHVEIAAIGPGGFFGELSLLDGGPRTATVRAVEATELLELERGVFMGFLMRRPDVALEVLSVLAARQRSSAAAIRSQNPNEAFAATRVTAWQRVSDVISALAASQWFMLFHMVWFGVWIGINVLAAWGVLPARMAFDPFPFGLLTMVVSLEAIFLAIFVMVSQNRQGEKDRLRTDLDYQVNVRAEEEVLRVSRRLEAIDAKLDGLIVGRRTGGGE